MGVFHSKTGRTGFSRRTEFCLGGQIDGFNYTSTIHESEDIIAGWHDITRNGEASKVLSVVEVRDGKVYEFHHLRAPI